MSAQLPVSILFIDDDAGTRQLIKDILKPPAYSLILAVDGRKGVEAALEHKPDMIISDLSLPEMNGLEVCREIRSWYAGPLIILSGHGEECLVVEALDAGADDYLTKPFRPGELVARIRAHLRRPRMKLSFRPTFRTGELEVNMLSRRAFRGGQEIPLTRKEFDILACLIDNLDCVVTPQAIFEKVWHGREGNEQTIRVHIGNLRKKVEVDPSHPQYILTAQGVGYRMRSQYPQKPQSRFRP